MRDVVTKQRRLSLAGRKPRISPDIPAAFHAKFYKSASALQTVSEENPRAQINE